MLTLAIKNLKRNKLRTTITILGIAIGSLLVSTILFAMISLRDLIVYHFAQVFEPESILLMSMSPANNFKEADIKRIKDIAHVKTVYPAIELNFNIPEKEIGGKIIAYPDKYYLSKSKIQKAIKEQKLSKNAIPIKKGHAIAGKKLYEKLGLSGQGSKVSLNILGAFQYIDPNKIASSQSNAEKPQNNATSNEKSAGTFDIYNNPMSLSYTFVIDGYVESLSGAEGYKLFISLQEAKEIITKLIGNNTTPDEFDQKVGYNLLIVLADSTEYVQSIAKTIEKDILQNKDAIIGTAAEIIDSVNKTLYILGGTLLFIALFSAVVASLGIINTMVMAVYEQKKEIGILKALGATNKQIFGLYALMSVFIGLLGGISGIVLAIALFKLSDPLIVQFLNSKGLDIQHFFVYKLWVLAAISAASAFIGFIAGVLPALKAAKMDPIRAIRG